MRPETLPKFLSALHRSYTSSAFNGITKNLYNPYELACVFNLIYLTIGDFYSIDISAEPRLKKLRHTVEERSIDGLAYQSRLRTQ